MLAITMSYFSFSQSQATPREKYFASTARIIESNFNNPQRCIKKIKSFIKRNKNLIEDIKSSRNEFYDQAKTKLATQDADTQIIPPILIGQSKFNEAMEKFSKKYPTYGQQIMALISRPLFPETKNE